MEREKGVYPAPPKRQGIPCKTKAGVLKGVHHVQKTRKVVRRLERQPGNPTPEVLPHKTGGQRPSGHHARRKNPSPRVKDIADLWAQTHDYHGKRAAKAIAAAAPKETPPQLTQAHADQAIRSLRETYSPATVHSAASHLRKILELCRDNGAPKLTIHARKARPRSVAPTEEELQAMYAHAQPWEKCWLILQAELGLRSNEARQVSDATHDAQHRTITIVGKGHKPRTMPTTDELERFFELAPKDLSTTSLLTRLRGRTVNQHVQERSWKRLISAAGARKNLRPHDLRRRAATRIYERTRDLRAAQQLLGHDNLQTTLVYLEHHEPHSLRPLIEALRIPTAVKQ